MFRKILIGLAAVLAVLVIVIATRPGTFHLERSAVINAPPATVFAQVNDFHAWAAWSPWDKIDPQLKRTYEGPATGPGATYSWVGNNQVGEGRMTIEKSEKDALVSIKLEFLKPFEATNTATFTFVPSGEGTLVTWSMDGKNNFMAKAFHMVMDMDKLVGADFERGLASMKTVAESAPKPGEAPRAVK